MYRDRLTDKINAQRAGIMATSAPSLKTVIATYLNFRDLFNMQNDPDISKPISHCHKVDPPSAMAGLFTINLILLLNDLHTQSIDVF